VTFIAAWSVTGNPHLHDEVALVDGGLSIDANGVIVAPSSESTVELEGAVSSAASGADGVTTTVANTPGSIASNNSIAANNTNGDIKLNPNGTGEVIISKPFGYGGTGVGGAVVVNGQLLRGGFGLAAELGHMSLIPGGRLCGCGQQGCIEAYGSGTALLRAAKELVASADPKASRLAQLQEENGELTGVQVYQALVERDPGAVELLTELGDSIGQTIATLCSVLDPEIVVIGGGVSAAGDLLLAPIRESYLKHLPVANFRPHLKIVTAEFVNDAGVVGAADLARLELAKQ
jgi:hypothetical protein